MKLFDVEERYFDNTDTHTNTSRLASCHFDRVLKTTHENVVWQRLKPEGFSFCSIWAHACSLISLLCSMNSTEFFLVYTVLNFACVHCTLYSKVQCTVAMSCQHNTLQFCWQNTHLGHDSQRKISKEFTKEVSFWCVFPHLSPLFWWCSWILSPLYIVQPNAMSCQHNTLQFCWRNTSRILKKENIKRFTEGFSFFGVFFLTFPLILMMIMTFLSTVHPYKRLVFILIFYWGKYIQFMGILRKAILHYHMW